MGAGISQSAEITLTQRASDSLVAICPLGSSISQVSIRRLLRSVVMCHQWSDSALWVKLAAPWSSDRLTKLDSAHTASRWV
ncbi:MAG: hypothetical protein FRX49_00522 [Trebouxia sp. A1-2]|nr:MAG: hypothetical protein FRX49_00522 [Trebouxia sp. A1-2]